MSTLKNYIEYNQLHHSQIAFEEYSQCESDALSDYGLEGFSDIIKWVKDTFKKIWEWFKGLWNKFVNMIQRWIGNKATSQKIIKVIECIESGAYTKEAIKTAWEDLFIGKTGEDGLNGMDCHGKTPFMVIDSNGKWRNVKDLINGVKDAIKQFNNFEWNDDPQNSECHLYVSGKPAVYRAKSTNFEWNLPDAYFTTVASAALGKIIEDDLLGAKLTPFNLFAVGVNSPYRAQIEELDKAVKKATNSLDVKGLVKKLNQVEKEYDNATSFYKGVVSDVEKTFKSYEKTVTTDNSSTNTKARVMVGLARTIMRFSALPLFSITSFMRLVDHLAKAETAMDYLTTDKCPANNIYHLSSNPELDVANPVLLPRVGETCRGEFLPKRVSFGTGDMRNVCMAIWWYFTDLFYTEDFKANVKVGEDGVLYRDLYVYEPVPGQKDIKYIKPEIMEYAHVGLLQSKFNEICVTTPITIKKVKKVRVYFNKIIAETFDQLTSNNIIRVETLEEY